MFGGSIINHKRFYLKEIMRVDALLSLKLARENNSGFVVSCMMQETVKVGFMYPQLCEATQIVLLCRLRIPREHIYQQNFLPKQKSAGKGTFSEN